jgi:hypothetical protein
VSANEGISSTLNYSSKKGRSEYVKCHTVARWPNILPNNSKQAQKIFLGREKLVAGKWLILHKSGRKEAEKSLISISRGNSSWYAAFSVFFIQ